MCDGSPRLLPESDVVVSETERKREWLNERASERANILAFIVCARTKSSLLKYQKLIIITAVTLLIGSPSTYMYIRALANNNG